MIFVDYIDRAETTATMPTVCMHCNEPTCALVCPADAIKMNEDGIVMSALKPRCLDCRNCVNACPFGVPKYNSAMHLQMKCDMCYDRTSEGSETDVRERMPDRCDLVRHVRADRSAASDKAGERSRLRQPAASRQKFI